MTCADVAYGVSRTFATDVVKGGPTDALAVLAIPREPDGTSTYTGPYATGAKAAAAQKTFDKAVSCKGQTITFTLSGPLGDFNELVSQPAFGPVKKSADRGAEGTFDVFSAGPYMLKGSWVQGKGGTWVRNPSWNRGTDPVRRAHADQVLYQEGLDTQAVAQQIMADGDTGRVSVSLGSAPPAIQQHITAVQSLEERSVNPRTGVVDYLVPNVRSKVFADEKVRLALAAATNRDAYVTAIGGGTSADPALSLIPKSLPAAHGVDPVGVGTRGDAAKAKSLLAEAGVTTPLPFTVAYRSNPTADKAMAALVAGGGWPASTRRPDRSPTTTSRRSATRPWPARSTCSGRTGRRPGRRPRRSCRRCSTARSTSPRSGRAATTATGTTRRSTPRWPRSTRSPTAPPARRPGPTSTRR